MTDWRDIPIRNPMTQPIIWYDNHNSCRTLQHGVTPGRWLSVQECARITGWCEEYIGFHERDCPNADLKWAYQSFNESFFFKTEADMVMFMLAHTGYYQDSLA